MQANFYFQVENHYNQDHTALAFTRTLREVPDSFNKFDRIWTLHILHTHSAPGTSSSNNNRSWGFIHENTDSKGTAEKIQNCVSTLYGIRSMGLEGTELRHQLLLLQPFSRNHTQADAHTSLEAHKQFPIEDWEEKRAAKAAESALKATIEIEKLTFTNAL